MLHICVEKRWSNNHSWYYGGSAMVHTLGFTEDEYEAVHFFFFSEKAGREGKIAGFHPNLPRESEEVTSQTYFEYSELSEGECTVPHVFSLREFLDKFWIIYQLDSKSNLALGLDKIQSLISAFAYDVTCLGDNIRIILWEDEGE